MTLPAWRQNGGVERTVSRCAPGCAARGPRRAGPRTASRPCHASSLRCQHERSNIAFTRIAGNEKNCRQPSMCVENCTTRPCKSAARPGRLTARASTTLGRRTNSQTSRPFERMFAQFTVKFCKMCCAVSTKLSRPFSPLQAWTSTRFLHATAMEILRLGLSLQSLTASNIAVD